MHVPAVPGGHGSLQVPAQRPLGPTLGHDKEGQEPVAQAATTRALARGTQVPPRHASRVGSRRVAAGGWVRLMMYCTARYRWLTPAAVSLPAVVLLPDAAGTGLGLDRCVQYLNT